MALDVYKITLTGGKQVLLRKMLIKHQEQAALSVGDRSKDNMIVFSMLMSKELLKLLIHSIDGKELKDSEKQVLDDLFDMGEYSQIMGVVDEISGHAKMGKPIIEVQKSGE